jgi:hypothetical protein
MSILNKNFEDKLSLEEFMDDDDILTEIRNTKNANKLNIL